MADEVVIDDGDEYDDDSDDEDWDQQDDPDLPEDHDIPQEERKRCRMRRAYKPQVGSTYSNYLLSLRTRLLKDPKEIKAGRTWFPPAKCPSAKPKSCDL